MTPTTKTLSQLIEENGTEGRSSYCPEDNKIRLYVGRVPREEYDALRAEGWTATPKQGCDFAAVWTPDRRDTALDYAGIIEDEDQGPDERACDRAERFAVYREKRSGEAIGHADRYDERPSAHGFQSQARAERASHCASHMRRYGRDYADQFKLASVTRITQAQYSANSKGSYARAETRGLHADAKLTDRISNMWSPDADKRKEAMGPALCMVRVTSANSGDYTYKSLIVLTDKPRKALPEACFVSKEQPADEIALVC